jgi:hypothetical protein
MLTNPCFVKTKYPVNRSNWVELICLFEKAHHSTLEIAIWQKMVTIWSPRSYDCSYLFFAIFECDRKFCDDFGIVSEATSRCFSNRLLLPQILSEKRSVSKKLS